MRILSAEYHDFVHEPRRLRVTVWENRINFIIIEDGCTMGSVGISDWKDLMSIMRQIFHSRRDVRKGHSPAEAKDDIKTTET